MNYNNGRILKDFHNQEQNTLEKIATDFSEGNELLKELLQTL